MALPPDPDGLARLVRRLGDADVLAVVETMNGARFVHDRLELAGWDVRIADAQRARALAPLACKTDRIAGVNDRIKTVFAGYSLWAVQDSNLRPWD